MGNWIIAALLAFAAVIGLTVVSKTERANAEARTSYAQSLAGNMQIYRNSVVEYAKTHATASGTVTDTNLALPSWYSRNGDVKNYVSGGLGYVYVNVQNDGQARELLKNTNNDVHVGIKRSGLLYNPIAGTTAIALPSAIPEGAVVFAPASLSTAAAPPTPTSPPANCTVSAGTTRSWTVSGNSCSAAVASSTTVNHLSSLTFTDAAPGTTGTAQFFCVDGALQTTPGGSPTCNPPPPCNVAAGTSRSWTVGAASCAGSVPASTVASGMSLTFTSTNGNDGAAGFRCTEGTLSATPDGSQTCVIPPAPCVLPTPSTQTNTETRTVSQTISGCPAGYTGTITQTRNEQRSQSRTAYCPAPTGPYSWGAWSAFGAWTATSSWTTTSSNCEVICTLPSPSTQTQKRWVTVSQACPSGYTGSHTWEDEEQSTRTAYCPASTGAYSWGAWSAWTKTGAKRNDQNTCQPAVDPNLYCALTSWNSTWTMNGKTCSGGIALFGLITIYVNTYYQYDMVDGSWGWGVSPAKGTAGALCDGAKVANFLATQADTFGYCTSAPQKQQCMLMYYGSPDKVMTAVPKTCN